jgi:hypothetical protein
MAFPALPRLGENASLKVQSKATQSGKIGQFLYQEVFRLGTKPDWKRQRYFVAIPRVHHYQ